jgi:para-aminobenzoate synthetase component 1
MFQPEVAYDNTILVTACDDVWERSRFEWNVRDGGNPAVIAENFLARFGLGLPTSAYGQRATTNSNHESADICGAAVFVSADGASAMHGLSTGPPTPVRTVPDLVMVVFAHGRHPELSLRNSASTGRRLAPESGPSESAAHEWRVGDWMPSWTSRQHADAVRRVREAIARGDVYQVNVVGHSSAAYLGDPMPALRRVAALPGAAYGRVLAGAGWAIATASPEMLVHVGWADNVHVGGAEHKLVVQTRPIKGTRPATAVGRRELLASAKERAEHIMIVDLERNDLGRIAATGTVEVPELFAVRRWCDLWQAESIVQAELAGDVGLADLLRAVLPGGSVTGAPKLAAVAEIARLEPVGRGPAMGALGWLDDRGLDLGLTIRTVAVDGNRIHLWAGGGITWDSDPDEEVAEAQAKAAPIRAALNC